MSNPSRVTNVLNAGGEQVGKFRLRELTLGQASILDKIKSPFVSGKGTESTLDDAIWAAFVLAHPAKVSRELLSQGVECLQAAALNWGEDIPFHEATAAIIRIIARPSSVAPTGSEPSKGNTPAVTAG